MSQRPRENATSEQASARPRAGRFSYEGLDRVMHEKARLSILASLAASSGGSASGGLLFNDLKKACSLTDGNLSRHLAVLTEAGLVEIAPAPRPKKSASGSRPQTMYRLTTSGRRRFAEYISVLEKVVADAQADARPEARQRRTRRVWSTT